jgi:hypothetical protein
MSQNPAFKPQTYEQWLSELKFQNEFADIIKTANHIAKISTNKKQAQVDVALVIVEKYNVDLQRAHNSMVRRTIETDYNKIAEALFKCKMSGLIKYALQNEPNLASHTRVGEVSSHKGKPLGFLQGNNSVDEKGNVRAPLGFIKPPANIVDEKGQPRPPLGFLTND